MIGASATPPDQIFCVHCGQQVEPDFCDDVWVHIVTGKSLCAAAH